MQILDLEKHHALLTLGLGSQLLHFYIYVTVNFLEQKHILGVEIRTCVALDWFHHLLRPVCDWFWCRILIVIKLRG